MTEWPHKRTKHTAPTPTLSSLRSGETRPTPGTVVAGAPLLPMHMPMSMSEMSENPGGGATEDAEEEPTVAAAAEAAGAAAGEVLLLDPGMTCWITRGLMTTSYRRVAP